MLEEKLGEQQIHEWFASFVSLLVLGAEEIHHASWKRPLDVKRPVSIAIESGRNQGFL